MRITFISCERDLSAPSIPRHDKILAVLRQLELDIGEYISSNQDQEIAINREQLDQSRAKETKYYADQKGNLIPIGGKSLEKNIQMKKRKEGVVYSLPASTSCQALKDVGINDYRLFDLRFRRI